MKNLTIRNIPDELLEKIHILSHLDKRSINSEILILLEKALANDTIMDIVRKKNISAETQINIWENICGKWEDERSTKEIIDDIASHRTQGRHIDL